MSKWVTIGALIGGLVGIILSFVYPELLQFEFLYDVETRQQTGVPLYPQYKSGSAFAVGMFVPLMCGLAGAGLGYFFYRVIHS